MKITEFQACLKTAMLKGLGNPKRERWSNRALTEAAGLGKNTLTRWQSDARPTPTEESFRAVYEVFFPTADSAMSPQGKRFLDAFKTLESEQNTQPRGSGRTGEILFSQLDVWREVLKTREGEFDAVGIGGPKATDEFVQDTDEAQAVNSPGYRSGELQLVDTGKKFFVKIPDILVSKAQSGEIPYDLHLIDRATDGECDIEGALIDDIDKALPGFNFRERITVHSENYANRVIAAFQSPRVKAKPFNKKKFGVYSHSNFTVPGELERVGSRLDLYQTDFFSNWVISRILDELRTQHPKWLENGREFPLLTVGNEPIFVPQLAPSLGLNCFILCMPPFELPSLCFTKLGQASSNPAQHYKLHVPVNEALNTDDIEGQIGGVSLEKWWRRMIAEEIGRGADIKQFEFTPINVFLDHTVNEFGVFGIVTTTYSVDDLNGFRNKTAGDDILEFEGRLISVPATDWDLIRFVLKQEQSINSFSTYAPHLVDTVIQDELLRHFIR